MSLATSLERHLNKEIIKRHLIRYFNEKGFSDNFDEKVNPIHIQDIREAIPALHDKIEMVPHAEKVDPSTGEVTLGWNLFVLGNQRMYLGETSHTTTDGTVYISEDGNPMIEQSHFVRTYRTARDVVTFVSRVLGASKAGRIDIPDDPTMPSQPRVAGVSAASAYFERPRVLRPETTSKQY